MKTPMKGTTTMPTLADLIATYNTLAVAAGLPTRKGFDNKAKALAAIAALQPAPKAATLRVRKAGAIRAKGPRGFKIDSPAWLRSIAAGKGIALSPSNLPKLLDTADAKGITVSADMTPADIAAAIAAA